MPKYEVELTDGRKFEVEADAPPTTEDVMAYLKDQPSKQTREGALGSTGLFPEKMSSALDQLGLGVLRGASELPGLPADAVGGLLAGMDYLGGRETPTANPLEMFSSKTIRSALGTKEGYGLLPDLEPQNGVERVLGGVGQAIGGASAAGAKGLMGLYGAIGGGTGAGVAKEVFPDSTIAPIIGGLVGGIGGAYAGARAPAPGLGQTDEMLEATIKAGKGRVSMKNTPKGPVIDPTTYKPAPLLAQTEARAAKRLSDQLELVDEARTLKPAEATAKIRPIEPLEPSTVNRLLFNVGLGSKDNAKNVALFDAVQAVDNAEPGIVKDLLKDLAKDGAKAYIGAKIGHAGVLAKALRKMAGTIAGASTNARLQSALDDLETVLRTQKPLPTKGTAMVNEAKGIMGQFGPSTKGKVK